MTREEAADLLDNLIGMVEDNQENDYDEALKMAIEALRTIEKQQHDGCVNCDKFDVVRQIKWERDTAIQQLKELGYGLGEKIRTKTMYYPQVDGITPSVIEPPAQRKGKWIYLTGLDVFECSVCGSTMVRNIFNYCPWCGAEMAKGEKNENKGIYEE